MHIDSSTYDEPSRTLRITARGLRSAVLALGLPVVLAGMIYSANGHERRPGLDQAPAEPALRGQFGEPSNTPITRIAQALQFVASAPVASPFVLKTRNPAERARAVQCLANAVYYEAALEPVQGQRAVAQVVVNRVRDPDFPHSICGVVYQGWERPTGCQFSFTCDGSLSRAPVPALIAQARMVAQQALNGYVMADVGMATHYHAASIDPWWRPTVVRVAQVGAHIFYRWPGAAGLPLAFTQSYAGGEMKLAQAIIDGTAPRPDLTPAQLAAIPVSGEGGLAAATGTIQKEAASGAQRFHVVALMPEGRRTPSPEEVAQINASLARYTPPAMESEKPTSAGLSDNGAPGTGN